MQVGGVKAKLNVGQDREPAPIQKSGADSEAAATYEQGGTQSLANGLPVVASDAAHGAAAIQNLNSAGADFVSGAQERIVGLGAAHFSPAAQANLIAYLDKHAHLPEDAGKLTWVANKVWQLTRGEPFDLTALKDYYQKQGMRLTPTDALPQGHPGYQVDRTAFRALLKRVQEEGGALDRRATLALIESLKNVVDADDLAWCSAEINNRIKTGRLSITDKKSAGRLDAFLSGKLAGRLGYTEIGLEMRWLRQSGFDAQRLTHVRKVLAECVADDQALFAAERAFHREANKARHQAQGDPAELARIDAARQELDGFFATHLAGKFDSYKTEKRLEQMHRKGQIDEPTLWAYRAAAVTSSSSEQFAYGVMSAQTQLALVQFQSQLIE
ncbi:MAG: hypothetical protein HYZ27_07735, partial [Deltaproteobacteria bacterium]|nr:hypothetical protein [Deltaproteobacteria bacterium]